MPLNTRLTAYELAFQIGDCGAALVVHTAGLDLEARDGKSITREDLLAVRPEHAPEPELADGGERAQVILYTSGTTGVPKGAVLSHRKTAYNTLNAQSYLGLRADDVAVVPIPLFHSFGLKILSVPVLSVGATAVLVDAFDPIGLQETLAEHRATLLGAVPVMYQRMIEAGLLPNCWRSLRFAFGAGAALQVDTIRSFHEIGVTLLQGYGQTETSILCCLDAEDALSRAGSVGRPVPHGEIRVGDAAGKTVAPGQRGEVLVRGPIVMSGYWQRPDATREATLDGWHRTGDLGVMDSDGFLSLVGRLKDMYITGGENVYPAEIEHVLGEHAEVLEVAVVGVPDPRWGESGRAYVVPKREPFDVSELLRWAAERLARYKIPREVVTIDELPRTASGKVQKHALLQRDPN